MSDEKVALVTGASRGLGRAIALEAARRGAHVIALARTVGGLEDLDDAIRKAGGSATLTPLDLTDGDGLDRLGAAIQQRWGKLDLWFHCAANAPSLAPAAHIDVKAFDTAMAVNAGAVHRLIRSLEPLLRAAPAGRAMLMDDRREGAAFFGAYAASKAAARALWSSWAREMERTRLQVGFVMPPPMPTAVRARFYPGENRDALSRPETIARHLLDEIDAGRRDIEMRHLDPESAQS